MASFEFYVVVGSVGMMIAGSAMRWIPGVIRRIGATVGSAGAAMFSSFYGVKFVTSGGWEPRPGTSSESGGIFGNIGSYIMDFGYFLGPTVCGLILIAIAGWMMYCVYRDILAFRGDEA